MGLSFVAQANLNSLKNISIEKSVSIKYILIMLFLPNFSQILPHLPTHTTPQADKTTKSNGGWKTQETLSHTYIKENQQKHKIRNCFIQAKDRGEKMPPKAI